MAWVFSAVKSVDPLTVRKTGRLELAGRAQWDPNLRRINGSLKAVGLDAYTSRSIYFGRPR